MGAFSAGFFPGGTTTTGTLLCTEQYLVTLPTKNRATADLFSLAMTSTEGLCFST